MKRFLLRTTVATTAVLALAGCSSSSSDSATGGSSEGGADAHGPITFAMGKNDTDKVTPIIEKQVYTSSRQLPQPIFEKQP